LEIAVGLGAAIAGESLGRRFHAGRGSV
jgi:hypothetical protein